VNDVGWNDLERMEANIRERLQHLDENGDRVLRLVDLLPLPPGLLTLGAQLSETEEDLRRERRETFALVATVSAQKVSDETAVHFTIAGMKRLKKITGRQSIPEITLEIIDLKMVSDRITKAQGMGRA
jgi:hypothetical protein